MPENLNEKMMHKLTASVLAHHGEPILRCKYQHVVGSNVCYIKLQLYEA
jgi:hypothetical protein